MMAEAHDATRKPSIVDRFGCAANDHEVLWTPVECCQCGQREDSVRRCVWCDAKHEPLCAWPTCAGHRMTLACCRVLESHPRQVTRLRGPIW